MIKVPDCFFDTSNTPISFNGQSLVFYGNDEPGQLMTILNEGAFSASTKDEKNLKNIATGLSGQFSSLGIRMMDKTG